MLNIDFTAQLPATLPGVNRNQVVKFNNSWVRVGQNGNNVQFLVAYRAMVHKVQDQQGAWVFANPAPQFPGQAGTPWGSGWGYPVGQAILEGQVPDGRGGRYFDGVGIARIQIDINNLGNPAQAFQVIGDEIIPNTDGYEDPRIFEANGRYFIHSHRYQPDSFRGAPGPQHRIYKGYAPARIPWVPGDINTQQKSLFVKITEVEFRNNRFWLGPEFYYGSNVSSNFEKNYGFFLDGDTLCAVYGVTPNNRPFTMLRAIRGLGGQAVHDFPRGNRFIAEEFQPNTDPQTGNARDCFLRLQQYYASFFPGPAPTVFSSSGPLIWDAGFQRWQGVGHVKVMHANYLAYIRQIATCALAAGQAANFQNGPQDMNGAYQALMNNNNYVTAVGQYLVQNPNTAQQYVANYLNGVTGGNLQPGQVADADRNTFINAIRSNFVRGSLSRRIIEAYSLQQGNVSPWQGNLLPNPRQQNDNRVIFHPSCFYYSFFYEIEANTYRLNRFSHSFLVYDQNNPAFLQFASNLARAGGNYLMSFGQDDNRTKVFQLTAQQYDNAMVHDATNFAPANYEFRNVAVNETVL